MSKRLLGRIIGCKDKTLFMAFKRFYCIGIPRVCSAKYLQIFLIAYVLYVIATLTCFGVVISALVNNLSVPKRLLPVQL